MINVYDLVCKQNKNYNINKGEAPEIRWPDEHYKYSVAANIAEYHIISN